jgi:Cu/Ag efflux protein CusF
MSETTVDHVDLDSDPFADDLSAQLTSVARPWHNRATVILGALALLIGGFLGGVLVEKHYGQSSAADAAAAQRAALANAFGNGGGFNRRPSTAPSTSASPATATSTGTIKLIDGTTVYLTLASGDVLTVRTSAATKITVGSSTKVSQLKVGQKISVTGATDSSGNVTAASITAD